MNSKWIYYHTNTCSKSREGLSLLTKSQLNPKIKDYKKEILTESELKELGKYFKGDPLLLTRPKDAKKKGIQITKKNWVQIIIKYPEFLQRPILKGPKQTILGRPIENINQVINEYH